MHINREHQRFFDKQAELWDSEDQDQEVESIQKIFREINCKIEGTTLDIGCGTGILVPILLKHLGLNDKVIEFDFSLEMLKQNRSKSQLFNRQVIYLNGDAHQLPFTSQRLNFLICFAILPHLSAPTRAFREWLRVLRQGGNLLILHLMSSQLLNQFHARAGQEIQHDHLRPAEEVADQLRFEGFQILHTEERDDLYLILAQKQ
jgi:ubiquinone/menaquinone biosynthesis C-methylase UbiE